VTLLKNIKEEPKALEAAAEVPLEEQKSPAEADSSITDPTPSDAPTEQPDDLAGEDEATEETPLVSEKPTELPEEPAETPEAPAETPEAPAETPVAPAETPVAPAEADLDKPADDQEAPVETQPPTPKGEEVALEEEDLMPAPNTVLMAGVSRAAPEKMAGSLKVQQARKGCFIKMPTYKKNDKNGRMEEINVPDPEYYHPVGYDKTPGDGVMHYRYVVKSELEESEYIDKSPFMKYKIHKGQDRGLSDSIFSSADRHDSAGQGSDLTTTGIFKAICRVSRAEEEEAKKQKVKAIKEKREALKKKLAGPDLGSLSLADLAIADDIEDDDDEDFEIMTKQLLQKTECVIRVYILDAFELAARDARSLSDPYVLVKVGDRTVGDPKRYLEDETSCGFYQYFELETTLPGPGMLTIYVMDHDDFFSDELIGKTKLDLEDRFFSTKW